LVNKTTNQNYLVFSMRHSTPVLILLVFFLLVSAITHPFLVEIKEVSKKLQQDSSMVPILAKWIQEKSVPGNETGVQNLITKELISLGFDVTSYNIDPIEMSKNPNFITKRTDWEHSPNIVGILRGSGMKNTINVDIHGEQYAKRPRSIILNGHIDIVPEGDLPWENDPFSGKVVGDRVYGRGSTDMKGGIFSSFLALKILQNLGIKLKGDVLFQSVIEEESGGAGTLSTIMKGFKADAAIIPEPTNLKIFPKQQGSTWFRIHVPGVGAHGGTRYEGVSAIEKSMTVIKTVQDLESKRNERFRQDPMYSHLSIPIPINIGKINGGKWPSSVADSVILEGRYGIAPFETIDEAKKELYKALAEIDDAFLVKNPVQLEFFGAHWVPGNVAADAEITKTLIDSFKTMTDSDPIIEGAPWGTDGGYLTSNGIPAIIFGPGQTKLAHQTNEYIEISKIFTCAEVIVKTLIEWCGVDSVKK
jgi:acetylornithine deacetylase